MTWIRVASIIMFAAVVFGAFGAHALKLSENLKAIYQAGVLYHLVHGLALFVVAWLATVKPDSLFVRYAGFAFLAGIFLFSGSLYVLAITGIKKFGMITPLGGLAFLLGWLSLIWVKA